MDAISLKPRAVTTGSCLVIQGSADSAPL
jgi:hypothetical protein